MVSLHVLHAAAPEEWKLSRREKRVSFESEVPSACSYNFVIFCFLFRFFPTIPHSPSSQHESRRAAESALPLTAESRSRHAPPRAMPLTRSDPAFIACVPTAFPAHRYRLRTFVQILDAALRLALLERALFSRLMARCLGRHLTAWSTMQ
jgi:hypothetical protein